MNDDTDLGGHAIAFPATQGYLVRAAADPDPAVRRQAYETLLSAYWKPVYKYLRAHWGRGNEDAKDLTQAFFVEVLEKGFFTHFDASRARFRTFVRLCVDGFVAKDLRAANRQKRGGLVRLLPLVDSSNELELVRHEQLAGTDPDEFFRSEWLRELFASAVEDLRQWCEEAGKQIHFTMFQRYDLLEPSTGAEGAGETAAPSYAEMAEEFGLPTTQVTNYLALARRQFRRLVLERLRAATGTAEEYQQEVDRLFGERGP